MRALLKIVAGAAVVFQLTAIAQEWPLFAAAWLGTGAGAPQRAGLSPEARRGAEEAVRQFNALSLHVYATQGDPRFTERLPAGPEVVQELLADIAYLQHGGLSQRAGLVHLQVEAVQAVGERAALVDTREYWVVSIARAQDGHPVEPRRSFVVDARYRVRLEGQSWRVEGWDLRSPTAPPGPGAETPG